MSLFLPLFTIYLPVSILNLFRYPIHVVFSFYPLSLQSHMKNRTKVTLKLHLYFIAPCFLLSTSFSSLSFLSLIILVYYSLHFYLIVIFSPSSTPTHRIVFLARKTKQTNTQNIFLSIFRSLFFNPFSR